MAIPFPVSPDAAARLEFGQALAEVRRLQELNAGLISDLADMVNQHCTDNRDGFIYDFALSANEDAIDRLVDLQVLRKCPGHLIRYEWGPTAPA